MSDLVNEIILRPRFEIKLLTNPEVLKKVFDIVPEDPFQLKRMDEHVYLKFKKEKTNFWTPQLHLEISSFENEKSTIHGVFGPNPTLWTFFMFLHFGVATVFIILGIFAFSKYSLGHDVTLLITGMALMLTVWIAFYIFGRIGKSKGKPQMKQLSQYLDKLLSDIKKDATEAAPKV